MDQQQYENLASLLSLLIGIISAIVLWLGWIPSRWIDGACNKFRRAAQNRWIWFFAIPIFSFAINSVIAVRNGIPHAFIHDEFSYLLAADTFAHGRLTNPTPPFWEHFETPHELMRPTYMSKYPPGQGIALAAGELLANKPIVGVWLSTALATAAIYWMLLGFVSPSWALIGGLIAAVHPLLIDWSRMYWGGSVAVLGAALVLGAWGRLMVAWQVGPGIALSFGLIILANSRPYEGTLMAAPLLILLVSRAIRDKSFSWMIPAGAILVIGAMMMGYYNYRITGHPLRMPFVEYSRQYDVYPKFWFLPKHPVPEYRNDSLRSVHTDFEKGLYDSLRTVHGFLNISWFRTCDLLESSAKMMVLLLPLAIGFSCWKDSRLRWVLITICICLPGLWAENFMQLHYEAPCIILLFFLIIVGLQKLWNTRPLSRSLALATLIGYTAGAVMADAQPTYYDRLWVEQQRAVDLEPQLQTGRHLIFVKYAPMHLLRNEYVYNGADLNSSRMIWARSFGPESDLPVAKYFSGRQVWILYVGGKLDLSPYLVNREDVTH